MGGEEGKKGSGRINLRLCSEDVVDFLRNWNPVSALPI